MMVESRRCDGWFSRWMQRRHWTGVTLPTPWMIYVFYWGEPTLRTVRHEWVHVQQARRLGVARFWWSYVVGLLRHGYRAHPMELEAYAREGDA
jgi:hypothetical protein